MTDTEAEQPIKGVALTKNCDRGLELDSASRTNSQTAPNLQPLESRSGSVKYFGLDAGNISKNDLGSNAVTDLCAGNLRNNQSESESAAKLCATSGEGGTQGFSRTPHPDATMPASLDCIRVLSSTNSMESERAASARSTRKAKKTRKQAKRFGFWVLSKIFV